MKDNISDSHVVKVQMQASPYTRKMLRIERLMKGLLGLCAVLVIGFLLILVGYLSFRGLFIRNDVQSAVLPDYRQEFPWPGPEARPVLGSEILENQAMSLWLSPTVKLGKLRGDQLKDILAGREKSWVNIAESSEKLTVLLTEAQLQSLEQANLAAGINWRKSRNIKVLKSYAAVAEELLKTPGALVILPSSWDEEQWQELQKSQAQNQATGTKLGGSVPQRISLATQSLALNSQALQKLEQQGELHTRKLGQREGGSKGNKENFERSVPLKVARLLLESQPEESSLTQTLAYNWLNGQLAPKSGYSAVQLRYREYQILKLSFLLEAPSKNGKVGGISTMLISSIILILVSLLWAVPLGLAVAVFLIEYSQTGATTQRQKIWQYRFANLVNIAIQTLSGIPSIIFGLFGSILFVPFFGISLLSGAATLVLMLLPTIILTAKEALLTVPRSYIEASLGLGAQKWYTILHISLPSALPGILAGIILAIGRALGETAALIYTLGTGYQATLSRFPQLLNDWPAVWQDFWLAPSLAKIAQVVQNYPLLDLHSSVRSISLHLYWMTINGISLQKGFSTAFILIFLIVLLNMGARALLSHFTSKHQALN